MERRRTARRRRPLPAERLTTRWSLNAIYENDGDFEGRDALGASAGTFNASNLAFGAQFARPFGQVFSLGAA